MVLEFEVVFDGYYIYGYTWMFLHSFINIYKYIQVLHIDVLKNTICDINEFPTTIQVPDSVSHDPPIVEVR